jgi:hypothetical protein
MINRQQFETGGTITPKGGTLNAGQRHSSGGIHLYDGLTGDHLGEVERGEALHVYSRSTVQNNGEVINALLDSSLYRGGAPIGSGSRKFETGGIIDVASRSGAGGDAAAANNAMSMALLSEIKGLRGDFQNFPRVLHARVDYEQNNRVAMQAAEIEAGADA